MEDTDHFLTTAAHRPWSRRSFLKWMFVAAGTAQLPLNAFGSSRPSTPPERALSLYNIHTGENFRDVYWAGGNYLAESIHGIDSILRDYRADEIITIDTRLIDLLYSIQCVYREHHPIQIISGYRSPETNEYLRQAGHRVARNSLHIKGKAADISLSGVPLADIRKTAIALKGGGVGYYPKPNFVHIDTGRIRYW